MDYKNQLELAYEKAIRHGFEGIKEVEVKINGDKTLTISYIGDFKKQEIEDYLVKLSLGFKNESLSFSDKMAIQYDAGRGYRIINSPEKITGIRYNESVEWGKMYPDRDCFAPLPYMNKILNQHCGSVGIRCNVINPGEPQ